MSPKVTNGGLPIVQPSTCLTDPLLNIKVHSVASFINNLLKISLEKNGVNFLLT